MRRAILVSVAIPLGLGALLMAAAGQGSPDQAPEIQAIAVHGKPVAPGVKLTVHVFPANNGRGGKPSPGVDVCRDADEQTGFALFAGAKQDGLEGLIDNSFAPLSVVSSAPAAIRRSLANWDAGITGDYFDYRPNDAAPERPGMDGTNVIGWARIVPKQVLAAAWVYTSTPANRVLQADIFYNISHTWGDLGSCSPSSSAFDVENIGTHEVGHILGLAHWSDAEKMATMYPSAPSGEIKKRSLTDGDKAGVTLALQ